MPDESLHAEAKDPRVDAALREYLERVDRGESVSREEFLARHAEIADALRSFITAEEEVRKLAGSPARPEVPARRDVSGISTRSFAAGGQETVPPKSKPEKSPGTTGGSLAGQFGRYQIVRALGKGAMGAVYLAKDTQLKRSVAIKTPHFEDDPTGELVARFYREAESAATLRHANICPVYDVGEIDGRHYISMAYIEGHPLSEIISAKKPQSERQILIAIHKLANALQQAHAHGIVHRDLKPANIMVDKQGEPLIMDFGLARKTRAEGEASLTHSGMLLGSPAYMSPEQVEGDQEQIGPATDQYSLGVILYELLTGQLPFRGTVVNVLAQIITKEPTRPSELRAGLDPRIEAVCQKMMAKNAADRFASMKAVAGELATIVRSPDAKPTPTEKTSATSSVPPRAPDQRSPEASVSQILKSAKQKSLTASDLTSLEELVDKCLARRDYDQVIKIVERVPEERRIAGLQSALEKAREKTDEIAFLVCAIDEADRLEDARTARKKAAELLKIKPGHHRAREIEEKYSGYGDGGAARIGPLWQFNQPWNEGGWIPWSVLTFGLAVFAVMTGVIVIYLGRTAIVVDIKDPGVEVAVTGTTLTVTGPDKQSVKVEPGEQELKITSAGLETTTKSFSLKKGEKKTVTVSIVNKEIVAQLENEILPLLTPAREEKASNPTASSTSPSLPLSAPVSQPRPVTAPDSRPISSADQEGVDHLKTILTSYAWKYFDSAYPGPGDPIRFHSNGKFHDVWHWNYWVVGPRTMHIQFWDAKYDPHSALVATFSDDLTTFHAAFPGHDITGKRQGPINADRASHSPTDPDRRAAEWVLSIGGRPGIESDGEERDVDQLPPGPFKLRKVQLYNNQKVNDAGLACLNGCRNLMELGLWLTKVSDAGLANVTDCKNLSVLYLSGDQVTDAGLAHFRECKGLTSLGLLGTKASDEGLAYFRNCTNLEVLELPDQSRVSDAGLLQFRDCRNLKKLNLYLAKITDAGLANLDGLVNLEYLSLAHTGQGVTDASLQRIGNLRRLKTLYLSGTRVTDAGLAHLEGLTQLELLEMDQTQIHGAGLKHLRNLVRLKSLGFRNLGLMDADLVHLRNLTALEFLGLAGTRVSGPGLANLKAMNQLHELDLNNSRILSSGLDHLKNLSGLVKLGLRGTQMTDAGLHHLEGMTNLDELDLSDTKVTAAGVATLHESLPACRIITKFATSASALDPFQPKSIWVGNKKPKLVLTVTERKGASFRAKFVVGPGITRMISGTVKDGKVDWFAKDVIAIKGRVGDDNHGTIASDDLGDKIDFVWGQGSEIKGQFTLRLQK